jgi:hypothetical protein
LTAAQLAEIQGAGDITVTPVYVDKEEEADFRHIFRGLPTNDAEYLFEEAAQTDLAVLLDGAVVAAGQRFTLQGISDVTYRVTASEGSLPTGYEAEAILRGIMTTPGLSHYLANAVFTTRVTEGDGVNLYIVVAEYAPEALPAQIEEPEEPEVATLTHGNIEELAVGLSGDDLFRVEGQGRNPFANIAGGNVPLGGLGAQGVWSFLSLILGAAGAAIAVVYAIGAVMKRRRGKQYEELGIYDSDALVMAQRRGNLLRALTILFGAITLLSWLILDDFSLGMVWINSHTILVGLFFLVTVVFCGSANARMSGANRYDIDEPESIMP